MKKRVLNKLFLILPLALIFGAVSSVPSQSAETDTVLTIAAQDIPLAFDSDILTPGGQQIIPQLFEPLVEFMMSGPIVAIVAEGNRVIEGFRSLAGVTDPTVAAPGTIRGDLARDQGTKVVQNIVHGSDSPESAAREIEIFFGK